jgi:RNA polymerase sigma factor (TIGR02999 family)
MAYGGNQQIEVTQLLQAARDGQTQAMTDLIQRVYAELREIAGGYLRHERAHHTLSTTDLVHEAYLKLVNPEGMRWQDRAHFFGAAARAMRQVLVDYARARSAQKRGGDWRRTTLSGNDPGLSLPFGDLLSVNDSLDRLNKRSPRLRQVVEMRFFAGMTEEEVAHVLDVTPRTVQRDWAKARAWLYNELHPKDA